MKTHSLLSSLFSYAVSFSILSLFLSSGSAAQENKALKDSIRQFSSEEVIITADRYLNKIAASTASVSYLDRKDISSVPATSPGGILNFIPGFYVNYPDGSGKKAVVTSRGFYGGGEAEYILVMLNGLKINDQETGLADFNFIPVNAIESIEVVRGSNSPLYGDAAMGGVININTAQGKRFREVYLEGGSYSRVNAGASASGMLGSIPFSIFLSNERTKGFRDHSAWQGSIAGGSLRYKTGEYSELSLSTLNRWTTGDEPGPVLKNGGVSEADFSKSYYKNDSKDEKRYQARLGFELNGSDRSGFSSSIFFRHKDADIIKTFTNLSYILGEDFSIAGVYDTSFYGDTKQREVKENLLGIDFHYNLMPGFAGARALLGAEFETGKINSYYYGFFGGFLNDFLASSASRGELLTAGSNRRNKYAFFVNSEIYLLPSVKLSMGMRYDKIDDKFYGSIPDTALSSSNAAFSPKIGLNYRYSAGEEYSANIYFSFNRSFKAPTIDQLTDQRPGEIMLFIPTGPSSFMRNTMPVSPYSNPALKPQRALSFDAGTYLRLKLGENFSAELMLSWYSTNLKDEIDFDFSTLKYRNILSSSHTGIESGLKLNLQRIFSVFFNYNYSSVKFNSGELNGKFLKGIPQNILSSGISYRSLNGFDLFVTWNLVGESYLEDDNTEKLPSYNVLGAGAGYRIKFISFYFKAENLLDRKFSSSGYIYSGSTFLFPAAGRSLNGGLRVEI